MNGFRLTAAALDDLDEILLYATQHFGLDRSLQYEENLFATFAQLGDFPGMGHPRSDLTRRPFLFFPNDPYLIVYEVCSAGSPLMIHGIVHASRNLNKVLRHRPT